MADGRNQQSFLARRASLVRALLLSPLVILFASAVRLLLVSDYDTTTATAIASTVGITGTLLGTLVPLLPPFLPLLVVLVTFAQRWTLAVLAAGATLLISPAYSRGLRASWDETYAQTVSALRFVFDYDFSSLREQYPLATGSAVICGVTAILLAPRRAVPWRSSSCLGAIGRLILAFPSIAVVMLCIRGGDPVRSSYIRRPALS